MTSLQVLVNIAGTADPAVFSFKNFALFNLGLLKQFAAFEEEIEDAAKDACSESQLSLGKLN